MQILIIEDDQRLANIIKRGLEENGYKASVAYDGQLGLRMALTSVYGLVISDIMLPGINGLSVCRKIRESRPGVPILMLTALGATDDKLEGFDAGADDYMVKPFELRELLARVKALLKRAGSLSKQGKLLRFADLEMDLDTKTVQRSGQAIKLTAREFNLLAYMMQNPNRVLSRDEIAEKVWDTHFDTGTNFIDVYINYLRKKIDKPFENKLIHTRTGMGFILSAQPN